jgi:hypothetical protein
MGALGNNRISMQFSVLSPFLGQVTADDIPPLKRSFAEFRRDRAAAEAIGVALQYFGLVLRSLSSPLFSKPSLQVTVVHAGGALQYDIYDRVQWLR